jgi:hypothetical protein
MKRFTGIWVPAAKTENLNRFKIENLLKFSILLASFVLSCPATCARRENLAAFAESAYHTTPANNPLGIVSNPRICVVAVRGFLFAFYDYGNQPKAPP